MEIETTAENKTKKTSIFKKILFLILGILVILGISTWLLYQGLEASGQCENNCKKEHKDYYSDSNQKCLKSCEEEFPITYKIVPMLNKAFEK